MADFQAFRSKTLTRSFVFAGLCLVVTGSALLVWMDNDVLDWPLTYTRENKVPRDGHSDKDRDHADTFADPYRGQAIAASSTTEAAPKISDRRYSVGELDAGTQAHIRQIVAAADAEKSYQVKTLDNGYFASLGEVTDGGQELTGYLKNGQIQKILYSVGLSLGSQKYQYYFDRGELVYVVAEEDDFPATDYGLDYEKLEPVFSAEYFFGNGKLLRKNTQGQGRYLSASTTDANALTASARQYLGMLSQ